MSRLSKNILYNFFGQGLLLVLGFVSVKYVFKQLGGDALGIIYFTVTLNIVLTSMLDKGISVSTVREVSSHINSEPDYTLKFMRTASMFVWSIFLTCAVAVYLSAPFLVEKWISLTSLDADTAIRFFQILGISSLSAFPRSYYISLLRGIQRMEYNNFIEVATSGIQQLGTILILIHGGNIFQVAFWFAVSHLINIIAYLLISSHFFSMKSIVPGYSSAVVKRNWSFSSRLVYISMLSMIQKQAEKIIVSKWLPISALGYYGFAYAMVSKAGLVAGSIAQAAFPFLSALYETGDRKGLIVHYNKLQDFICFVTVPLFALIPFISFPLVTYVFNVEIALKMFLPITFLCVGFYLNGTLNLWYQFSLAVGRPDISVRSNIYALFILPIAALLIYHLGLAGAGLAWVCFNIFVYIYAVPRICRECVGVSVGMWYLHMLKILLLTVFTYGVARVGLMFLGEDSILPVLCAYVIATITFLSASYFMIGEELRRSFLRYIQTLRYKFHFREAEESM